MIPAEISARLIMDYTSDCYIRIMDLKHDCSIRVSDCSIRVQYLNLFNCFYAYTVSVVYSKGFCIRLQGGNSFVRTNYA